MADGEFRSAVLQTISQPGARGAATTDDQGRAREGAANSAGGKGQPAQAGACANSQNQVPTTKSGANKNKNKFACLGQNFTFRKVKFCKVTC